MSFPGALDMIRDQTPAEALKSIAFLRHVRAECGPALTDDERAELMRREQEIRRAKR